MTLGEKIKINRIEKGLSQEKLAEIVGVSRQAVTKWESNQSMPSTENIITLSATFGISLDDLADDKIQSSRKDKKILHSNLTLIAIILQAAALNVCIQPVLDGAYGIIPDSYVILSKIIPLTIFSIWMASNLRYEKNAAQYKKNAKIEFMYCGIQSIIALFAIYSELYFVGTILILITASIYIFIINPRYMNRTLIKSKK